MEETSATLLEFLRKDDTANLTIGWSAYGKEFYAVLTRSGQYGVEEEVTRGYGKTVEDAISIVDTTLLAQSLRDKIGGAA